MESPQGSDNGETHGDRLSLLPDHILVEILSLLPTKTAVITGVLSQRWRGLWTQTPILDLDISDFPDVKTCDSYTFVDRILRQLTSPEIRSSKVKLRLFHPALTPSSSWMSLICSRNVKEFELTSDSCLDIRKYLPSSVLECQSLVSLKLDQRFFVRVPFKINLPNLNKFFVHVIECDSEWMRKLFRNCPLLEELSLEGSFSKGEHFVEISAQNLKRLTFEMGSKSSIKVAIDAPNLSFFYLWHLDGVKLWFVNQPRSSLEMHIYCGYPRPEVSLTTKLFQGISNVRSLTLHSSVTALNFLDDIPKLPTLFRNLSCLSLWMVYSYHLNAFLALLHCAPNLEFLALTVIKCYEAMTEISSLLLDSPPACLSTHVKRLHIWLWGSKNEMELVKYLLCNTNVLECLIVKRIGVSGSKEVQLQEELELYEELCKLPKSSPSCQIKLCGSKKLG